MSNKNHHGPHCAGLCEGQAYNSRIKELEGEIDRLHGDAAEAEVVIRDLYDALEKLADRVEQMQYDHNTCDGDMSLDDARAALAKARGEQP